MGIIMPYMGMAVNPDIATVVEVAADPA